MKINIDDEKFDIGYKYDEGEFEKVPIENIQTQPIEISNNDNKFFIFFKKQLKNKFFLIILVFLVFIFFFIAKRIVFNNKISPITKDDTIPSNSKKEKEKEIKINEVDKNDKLNIEDENNELKIITDINMDNNNINKINDNKNINYHNNNINLKNGKFYISQKKEKIKLKSFYSPQLQNPDKIRIIENLEISLDLEYENFVHLKIKDASEKRWEVPEDVLNEDYIKFRNKKKISLLKNSSPIKPILFNIELLSSQTKIFNKSENMNDIFAFKLTNNENLEFYSFTTEKNFLYSDTYINFESRLTSNDIYGFGERTHDFKLDDRLYTIWPNDCGGTKYDYGRGGMNQYSHQPIGLHKTKYKNLWVGFVFLNTNAQDVVIQSFNEDDNLRTYLTHKTIGGIIDYYIIVNNSPEKIVRDIHFLLGIPPLPPYWSLGYHQSRYGYKSFKEFKDVYEKYKKNKIAIDTMWIDIDSLDNFEIFTINNKFKDMSKYVNNNIHKDGGKFIPIVDIGISYENMRNPYIKLGNELDIFIKSNYTKKPLIGKVWPGKTVFPDFFNPKIEQFWFKGLDNYYNLIKYDGIWLDMNEPANLLENSFCVGEVASIYECTKDKNKYHNDDLPYFPGGKQPLSLKSINENALVYGNNAIYDVKPLISYYQTKHTYKYLETKLEIRPFVLSRSTSIGSGKYTFHWLGDNFSSYSNLKDSISGIFNFNIFGIPFSGSDICGFMDNSNKNLCIRWYNLGVFYPFSRNHNFIYSRDQFPWSFGINDHETINIIRKDINYRYSLLRYIYSQFFLISLNKKGSFFKPLMFEFPEEKTSYEDIESKIMFGEAFLICAFYESNESSKRFNLPNANFNDYPTGKSIINYGDENLTIELSGELNKLYIFARGGYIIPSQDTFNKFILNSVKLREEHLNLIINPDENKESRNILFFDNDDINTIDKKTYYEVELFFKENKLNIYCNKNSLDKYIYNDHILGKIEIWRVNEVFKLNGNNDIKSNMKVIYNYDDKDKETFDGIFDKENSKIIFDISKNEKKISIFDIKEIIFNF